MLSPELVPAADQLQTSLGEKLAEVALLVRVALRNGFT